MGRFPSRSVERTLACKLRFLASTIGEGFVPRPRLRRVHRSETLTLAGYLKWKDTGKWPDDKQANAALTEHGKYWSKQLKAGRALLAGGMKGDFWDNVALIVFEAGSQAEAEQIAKDDPAVRAYVFQAQVRPFDVSFLSNKYQTDRSVESQKQ